MLQHQCVLSVGCGRLFLSQRRTTLDTQQHQVGRVTDGVTRVSLLHVHVLIVLSAECKPQNTG